MTIGQDIDRMVAKLRQQRDELKLQAHLLKAEASDEWRKAEEQWRELEIKASRAKQAGAEAGDDVADAVKNLGSKIQEGYRKVRDSM